MRERFEVWKYWYNTFNWSWPTQKYGPVWFFLSIWAVWRHYPVIRRYALDKDGWE